jgi:Ca2+-binding RTX toxin-like protein
MATITMTQPMNTVQFIMGSTLPITFVSANAAGALVYFGNDLQLGFTGSGLSFAGNEPNGGSVTRIIATRIENGVPVDLGELVTSGPWLFTRDGLQQGYDNEGHFITDSSGFDVLYGSDFVDTIVSRQAEDWIYAGGGDDLIRLETALRSDQIDPMEIDGGAGNDTLEVKGAANEIANLTGVTLIGIEELRVDSNLKITLRQGQAEGLDKISALGGIGVLTILQEQDVLNLNSINLDLSGASVIAGRGRGGADRMIADNELGSILLGQGGADRLIGGTVGDLMTGGRGADSLTGGLGADALFGGVGGDRLNGGQGDDTLTGGAGRDTFVFGPQSGDDTIRDMRTTGRSGDRIDLTAIDAVTGFRDLMRNHFSTAGGNSTLDFGDGNRVLLIGVDRAGLDAGDFLFG